MKNLILIGMSGAGKSTLGVLLAKALGQAFIDTDILIQQQENRLLQEIIDQDGIDTFLKIEETVVLGLTAENCVISTGGSVIYSAAAMKALKRNGTVIYLFVPYEELEQRLTNTATRGIVIKEGHTLRDVYEERLPLYQKYGDITIDCSQKTAGENVKQIIEKIS